MQEKSISDIDSVEKYIQSIPLDVQLILSAIREIITAEAPEAEEGFSYGMPAYKSYGKPLVYFAAFKNHIGFYALPSGHKEFLQELKNYKQGKGSVRFPIKEPIPFDLIARMVRFRVEENKSLIKKK
jgi:uncharacterized protein YdhG (YjbR/CyaY superfamily)